MKAMCLFARRGAASVVVKGRSAEGRVPGRAKGCQVGVCEGVQCEGGADRGRKGRVRDGGR
eukprot:2313737-Rhodomonas_salina.2